MHNNMIKIFTILVLLYICILTSCKYKGSNLVPNINNNADCERLWQADITSYATDLDFIISVDKNTYSAGEAIWTNISIINVTSYAIWINKRMIVNRPVKTDAGEIYFNIVAPWGETAIFYSIVDAYPPELVDYLLLNPGNTFRTRTEGIALYNFPSLIEQRDAKVNFFGKYCVWAIYHNQDNPGLDGFVWKGKLKSNYLEYIVEE
jgi:hypothetical protein